MSSSTPSNSTPHDANLRGALINAFISDKRPNNAAQFARKGLEIYPDDPLLLILLAKSLLNFREPDHEQAESILRKARNIEFSNFSVVSQLASFLIDRKRYDEARQLIVDVQPHLHDPAPALVQLAAIDWESGRRKPALRKIKQVLKNHPRCADAWLVYMNWLGILNKPDRSIELIKSIPSCFDNNLAILHVKSALQEQYYVASNYLTIRKTDNIVDHFLAKSRRYDPQPPPPPANKHSKFETLIFTIIYILLGLLFIGLLQLNKKH